MHPSKRVEAPPCVILRTRKCRVGIRASGEYKYILRQSGCLEVMAASVT